MSIASALDTYSAIMAGYQQHGRGIYWRRTIGHAGRSALRSEWKMPSAWLTTSPTELLSV